MTEFNVLAIDPNDAEAPKQFFQSLRDTGFAILKNHPITSEEIDAMYGAWAGFFEEEGKHEFAPKDGRQDGYFGYKFRTIMLLTNLTD